MSSLAAVSISRGFTGRSIGMPRRATTAERAASPSDAALREVGEVFGECFAEFVELGGHRVLFERPFFEQTEERGSLGWVEFDGSCCADGFEGGAEARGVVCVLQSGVELLACVPGEGHVTPVERDGDLVETLGHRWKATSLRELLVFGFVLGGSCGPFELLEPCPAFVEDVRAGAKEGVFAATALVEGEVDHGAERRDVETEIVDLASELVHTRFCAEVGAVKREAA